MFSDKGIQKSPVCRAYQRGGQKCHLTQAEASNFTFDIIIPRVYTQSLGKYVCLLKTAICCKTTATICYM